jgi:hypothetical protein
MIEPNSAGLKPGFSFEDPSKVHGENNGQQGQAEEGVENNSGGENKIELKLNQEDKEKTDAAKAALDAGENKGDPPVVNEEQFLKDIFGEGHPKSLVEAKTIRERDAAELRKLNEDHVRAKSEIDRFKSRVSLMESPQFLSATKFSHFAKEAGIEVDYGTFQKLEKFDPTAMSDIDAIVMLDYLKFQDKGRNHDLVNQGYKLGDYADEVEDAEGNKVRKEREIDKNALGREAVSAKKELSQYKEKIASFKPEFQDNSAEKAARQESWKKAPERLLPFFTKIDPPITEIKGIKIEASYQITPEDQVEIKQEIKRIVESNDMELTQENANLVYLGALSKVKERREAERFKIFGEKLIAGHDMLMKQRYSNYQGLDVSPERKAPEEKKVRTDGAMTASEAGNFMLSRKPR